MASEFLYDSYDPTIKNTQLLLRQNRGSPSKLYLGQILQEEAWIV